MARFRASLDQFACVPKQTLAKPFTVTDVVNHVVTKDRQLARFLVFKASTDIFLQMIQSGRVGVF